MSCEQCFRASVGPGYECCRASLRETRVDAEHPAPKRTRHVAYGDAVEVDGLRGTVRPLELEPAEAAKRVLSSERVSDNSHRATAADGRIV